MGLLHSYRDEYAPSGLRTSRAAWPTSPGPLRRSLCCTDQRRWRLLPRNQGARALRRWVLPGGKRSPRYLSRRSPASRNVASDCATGRTVPPPGDPDPDSAGPRQDGRQAEAGEVLDREPAVITGLLDVLGDDERVDPGDLPAVQREHVQDRGCIPAQALGPDVAADGELAVRAGGPVLPAHRADLVADELGDGCCPADAGALGRHRPGGIPGEHAHQQIRVAPLDGVGVAPGQGPGLRVAER